MPLLENPTTELDDLSFDDTSPYVISWGRALEQLRSSPQDFLRAAFSASHQFRRREPLVVLRL